MFNFLRKIFGKTKVVSVLEVDDQFIQSNYHQIRTIVATRAQDLGLDYKDIADRTRLAPKTVKGYLNGEKNSWSRTVMTIADAVGVDFSHIFD